MKRNNTVQKVLLGVLVTIAVVLGAHAWLMYRGVVRAERLFKQADDQMMHGEMERALVTLEQVIAADPLFFPAYEAKSDILVARNDRAGAVAALLAAVPYLNGDPRLHQALGHLYLYVMKDYTKAQAELRLACNLDPSDSTARGMLRRADAQMVRHP